MIAADALKHLAAGRPQFSDPKTEPAMETAAAYWDAIYEAKRQIRNTAELQRRMEQFLQMDGVDIRRRARKMIATSKAIPAGGQVGRLTSPR